MLRSRVFCQSVCYLTVLISLICASSVFAQVQTGGIQGDVTDATGAAIPGANVTITNADTGIARQMPTDSQGRYAASSLDIGNYRVQVSMQGFATQTQQGLVLTIGQVLPVNFTLQVGSVAQEVTVNAAAVPQVNTTTSETGALVESAQLQDLPLNGRNVEQLVALVPSVQPIQSAPSGGANFGNAQRYSIAGARVDSGSILLDGLEVRGFWGVQAGMAITGTSLGVESIAQFVTLTTSFNAEYNGASVINEVTRSGTNNFHGSAYGFFRNSAMDSRNFFDPITGPPAFHRNQFGGALGGPIQKNKTFFFVNYEGIRAQLALRDTLVVPDANAHNGMLPCAAIPAKYLITPGYPACTGAPGSTLVNVGVNPTMVPYLGLEPTIAAVAGTTTGTGSFIDNLQQTQTENYFAMKLDRQITTNNKLAWRWVVDKGVQADPFVGQTSNVGTPGLVPLTNVETDPESDWYATLQDTHIFSPNLINVATVGFVRTNQQQLLDETKVPSFMKVFTPYGDVGSATITGVATIGYAGTVYQPLQQLINTYTEQDEIDWVHGAHSFKFGGGVSRIDCNCIQAANAGGLWSFPSLYEFLQNLPNELQSAFSPTSLPISTAAHRYNRQTNISGYIQDDWRVTRRLTVNMGIRDDFITNPTETRGFMYDMVHLDPFRCGNNPLCDGGVPETGISMGAQPFTQVPNMYKNNPSTKNIDPRIGLAWDISGNGKTSFRAAFGTFHGLLYPRVYSPGTGFIYPNGTTQLGPSPNPFGPGFTFPTVPLTGAGIVPPQSRAKAAYDVCCTPYMEEWNATLERQLPWGLKASIGYVGSEGVHLYNDQNFNTNIPVPGTQFRPLSPAKAGALPICITTSAQYNAAGCTAASAGYNASNDGAGLTPNVSFSPIANYEATTNSNYHAAIVTVSRHMGRGVDLSSGFTYSRCNDYGSTSTSGIDEGGDSETFVYPSISKKYNYGPCAFDIGKNWTSSALIPIPLHGNRLKEGWQIAMISSARTGTPETANLAASLDQENIGQSVYLTERANVNPAFTGSLYNLNKAAYETKQTTVVPYLNANQTSSSMNCTLATNWVNCPFIPGTIGQLGNAPRGTIRAPKVVNVDLSIIKNTKLPKFGEAAGLEIRGDFFNAMNHTNFALPGTTIFSGTVGNPTPTPQVGTISSTSTPPRQLQFSARFVF
jgi:hypothetical protein